MLKGSTKQSDPGKYEVWLVGEERDFLWVTGLVRVEDAVMLAEQANKALIELGRAGAYVVREKVTA